MDWIERNAEWIFSGIGVVVLVGLVNFLRKRSKGKKPTSAQQNMGTNIKAGGNVTLRDNEQKMGE